MLEFAIFYFSDNHRHLWILRLSLERRKKSSVFLKTVLTKPKKDFFSFPCNLLILFPMFVEKLGSPDRAEESQQKKFMKTFFRLYEGLWTLNTV